MRRLIVRFIFGAKVKKLDEDEAGKILRSNAVADIKLRYKLFGNVVPVFKGNGHMRYPHFKETDVDIADAPN